MLYVIWTMLYASSFGAGIVVPRDDGPPDPGDPTVADPGLQSVPDTAKAPNTFNKGQAEIIQGYPYSADPIPDLYQPRDIDIPFGRVSYFTKCFFPNKHRNKGCERNVNSLL